MNIEESMLMRGKECTDNMFEKDTDKTISITRGDSGSFVAPIDYALQSGDVLRLKVFRKKACEDVVLQKDFAIGEATETVTLELTEKDTRIGEVISKPVDYWYEIELNPDTNPKTLVGYDEDGAKIFRLYPEGRDLEDDELTEKEKDTHRKLLDEFRKDIPKETQKYLDEHIDSIAADVEEYADFERKANKLSEYKEDATDEQYYSAKATNEMLDKEDIEQSVKDLEKSLSKYQLKTQKLVAINPKDTIKIWELETGVYRFSGNIYTRVENGEPTGALNYNENSVLIVNKRYAGGNQIYNWFILGEFVNHYTTGYVPINTGFFYVTKDGNIVSKEWKIQGDAIVQDIASNANNSSTYPSTKAVYDYVQSVIPPTAEEVEY
jgi:hypothetical protein